MKLTVHRSSLVGWIGMPILVFCCVVYYIVFAADLGNYASETGLFQYALNSHDHYVYLLNMDLIRDGESFFELANDKGIALIFLTLSLMFPSLINEHLTLIALIFNCLTLCCCYWFYAKICERLDLGALGKLTFFANFSVIYFAQLINKDMLTILAFLLAVYCGMKNRLYLLLLLMPVFVLVRIQLVVFVIIFLFLMTGERAFPRILISYVATSLVAGYLSVFYSIIGVESLGDGFSSYLVSFNQKFYTGYLLFNPVRVVQYFIDAYSSFLFFTPSGGINTAKFLRLPQLLLMLLLLMPLSALIFKLKFWLQSPARPLILVVIAYLLTWLMNPTVNARYVMLITPILVLFALYVRHHRQKGWA